MRVSVSRSLSLWVAMCLLVQPIVPVAGAEEMDASKKRSMPAGSGMELFNRRNADQESMVRDKNDVWSLSERNASKEGQAAEEETTADPAPADEGTKDLMGSDGSLTDEEKAEVEAVFGVVPAKKEAGMGYGTGNSSYHQEHYYDGSGASIGTRHVKVYHPIGTDVLQTTVTWTDANGEPVEVGEKPGDEPPDGDVTLEDGTVQTWKDGRLVRQVKADDARTTYDFEYDADGTVATVRVHSGLPTLMGGAFAPAMTVYHLRKGIAVRADGAGTERTYKIFHQSHAPGMGKALRMPQGYHVMESWDADGTSHMILGRLVSVKQPDGTVITYDEKGRIESFEKPDGSLVRLEYAEDGPLAVVTAVSADGGTVTVVDLASGSAKKTLKDGSVHVYRVAGPGAPEGARSVVLADWGEDKLLGIPESSRLADGTEMRYDGLGRLAETRVPGKRVVTLAFTYDEAGRLVSVTKTVEEPADRFGGDARVLSVTEFDLVAGTAREALSNGLMRVYDVKLEEAGGDAEAFGVTLAEWRVWDPAHQDARSLCLSGALKGVYLPDGGEFVPFKVAVSTGTDGVANLFVSVDDMGRAQVTWYGVTYEGIFDFNTDQLVIEHPWHWGIAPARVDLVTADKAGSLWWPWPRSQTWTFNFTVSKRGFALVSFEQVSGESPYQNVSTMFFDLKGRLERSSWSTEFGVYRSGGETSYTYVMRNGKALPSSVISEGWSEGGWGWYWMDAAKRTEYGSKTFYTYDRDGGLRSTVSVSHNSYDGAVTYRASYTLYVNDKGGGRMLTAWVNTDKDIYELIGPRKGWVVVDRLADLKQVYHFSGKAGDWSTFRFSIEMAKKDGTFVPKKVNTAGWAESYIVVGKPDVTSGQKDDIKIKNWQQVGGYSVSYGAAYEYPGIVKIGPYEPPKYLGYGLTFSRWFEEGGVWKNETVLVDYPKEKTVTLAGKKKAVSVKDGLVVLSDIEEPVNLGKDRRSLRAAPASFGAAKKKGKDELFL